MPMISLNKGDADLGAAKRSLLVIWQDPQDRRFSPVGRLSLLPNARYAFEYTPAADGVVVRALEEFPDVSRVYISDELPAFFSNRVMSSARASYGQYLDWLGVNGLEGVEVPLEILSLTGGGRVTDTFHIVEEPRHDGFAHRSRFFVSGVRYAAPSEEVLRALENGAELSLRPDRLNPRNARAVIIASDGTSLGWVPDWLCDNVSNLLDEGWSVRAVTERVNLDAPHHVRILCRIEAERR